MIVENKHPLLGLPDGFSSTATGTIKAHLDLLLLGLECLSGESSEAVLSAARELHLDQWVKDRVNLWRLRNASPLRRSPDGRKKVDIEEARALVLIIAHLASQQHQQIRSVVAQLESAVLAERSPFQEPLVGDYLDEFHSHYRSRMIDGDDLTPDRITELGLRLLIEILFYSSKRGSERLWKALLTRPEMQFPPQEDIEEESSSEDPA